MYISPSFGIRIATYRRPSGTFHLLHRCIKSILAQTYTQWKVFLIGDCYLPSSEFMELVSMLPCYSVNLPSSPEREKYTGNDLWKVAGFTASVFGLRKIQEEGLIHVCLDDDDWWLPDHLETLAKGYIDFPKAVFVYTQSTHKGSVLPLDKMELFYDNLPPRACGLVHSAVSWDTLRLPLTYRNIILDGCNYAAGDAEMWDRIRDYCWANGLKTLYIPKLTVHHDDEQGNCVIAPLLL